MNKVLTIFIAFIVSACFPPFRGTRAPKDPIPSKLEPKKPGSTSNNDANGTSLAPFFGYWSYPCQSNTESSTSWKYTLHITQESFAFVRTYYGIKANCTGDIPNIFETKFTAIASGPSEKIEGATDVDATFVSYSYMPLMPGGLETLKNEYPYLNWTLYKSTAVERSKLIEQPLLPGNIRYTSMKIIGDSLCFSDTTSQYGETKETRGDNLQPTETCSKRTDRLN
jgi:hypothetical protein